MENKNSFFDSPLSSGFLQALQNAIHAQGGQAAVAKAAGMAQGNISKILKGRDVRVSTLGRLLAALGGGLAVVGEERTSIVRETPAEFQLEMQRAKEKLLEKERETFAAEKNALEHERNAIQQQKKIMEAVTIMCREQALTESQAHAIQAAVANYESVLAGTHQLGFISPTSVVLQHASSE